MARSSGRTTCLLLLFVFFSTPALATKAEQCKRDYQKHRLERALDSCRAAISLDAKVKDPYWILSEIYLGMGEFDYATSYAQQLINHEPQEPRGWYALGKVALRKGQLDQAKLFFQKAREHLKAKPDASLGRQVDRALAEIAKKQVLSRP